MADSTIVLVPDSTVIAAPTLLGGGGSQTTHGNLADESDVSYVQGPFRVGFTTAALPVGVLIRGVRFVIRVYKEEPGAFDDFRVRNVNSAGVHSLSLEYVPPNDDIWYQYVYPTWTTNPAGAPWAQADIDSLVARVDVQQLYHRVSYLRAEIVYNATPTVTVTGPADVDAGTAGVQVGTTSPASAFTYSDPESDTQERYWGKTFSSSQYGAGGFNPETSAATRDSGEVFSQATTPMLPGSLTNGATYKDYFKVSDAGSGGRYSGWSAGPAYTVVTSPPPVPTLIAQAVYGVAVALEATSTGTPAPEFLRFETLVDGLWIAVRGAEAVPTTSGATKGVLDFEWRSGVQSSYRAFSIRGTGPSLVQSAPSTVQTLTLTLTEAEIADPLVPLSSVPLVFRRTGVEIMPMESEERGGRFVLSGVPHPVFVSDVVSGEEWDMDLVFQTQASYEAFEALRQAQRTLLLRAPDEPAPRNHMYVRLGPVRREALVGFDRVAKPWRYVAIHASERARP